MGYQEESDWMHVDGDNSGRRNRWQNIAAQEFWTPAEL